MVPKQPDPLPPAPEKPREPEDDIRRFGKRISDAAERFADEFEDFREKLDDEQQDLREAFETLHDIGNSLIRREPVEPPVAPPVASPVEDALIPTDPPNDTPATAQPAHDERKGGSLPDWLPWVIAGAAGIFAVRRKP